LPEEAQELYLEAYNKQWAANRTEANPERRDAAAHQAGWAAVEEEYVHDETEGRWYHKDELEEEDEQGILDKLKSLI